MPLTRIFGLGLSIVILVTVFSSVGSAQIKRPLRWLGEGFSDGYHRCNPGPNSDYYNPYSANNAYLLHKYGAPTSFSSSSFQANGTAEIGVPFSVQAAHSTFDNGPSLTTLPSAIFDNSFVPNPSFALDPPSAQPIPNNDWPSTNNDWPSTNNDWPSTPYNNNAVNKKKQSTFAPQLKKRFRLRSSDAFYSPNRFSILD